MTKNLASGVVKLLGLALCATLLGAGSAASAVPPESGSPAPAVLADVQRAGGLQLLKDRQVGAVHPLIRSASYVGALPTDRRLSMTISFQPNRQEEIAGLLAELYTPASPNYHNWLTPEQWADRFGRSAEEVAQAAAWLRSAGFTVDKVWENRLAISFSGSAEVVQKAFRVQLGQFRHSAEARTFFANLQRPQLPAVLDSIAISLVGLNNAELRHHPDHGQARPVPEAVLRSKLQPGEHPGAGARPNALFGGSTHFVGPQDLSLVYGYQSLISGGVANQGTGQRIGVIIDSDVLDSDRNSERTQLGLPSIDLVRDVPPGLTNPGPTFEGEAELDIDTISNVVPKANIHLIIIDSLNGASITAAENYAVNSLQLPVVNESFGGCESTSFDSSEQTLFQQAAAAGTAFFASSGDEGVVCASGPGGQTVGVELPAAYDSVVAVGGTTLQVNYDSSGNVTAVNSDVTWNTPPGVRTDCNGNSTGGGATGGGVAGTVARPGYQSSFTQPGAAHGVPSGSKRVVPDLGLVADPSHDSLIFVINGSFFFGGGTSQASPLAAGLMTLLNQFKGTTQGLPNSELYRQGAQQYDSGGPTVFRDITMGNNNVVATAGSGCAAHTGYTAGIGYDAVTGWGALQLGTFAHNFGSLTAPVNLTATAGNAKVTLNWTSNNGTSAKGFYIYQGTSPSGEGTTQVAVVSGSSTSATIYKLNNGTTYYFKIKAANSAGFSAASNEASATPATTLPATPTNLMATAGNAKVTLNWTTSNGTAGYGNANGYYIYQGTSPGGEGATQVAVVSGSSTSTTVYSLNNGTTYYFKIKAANSAGFSAASNETSATPN